MRGFGVVLLVFFSLLGAVVGHQLQSTRALVILGSIGAALALFYYAAPPFRIAMFRSWMALVMPIGRVFSLILLGLVYFGILTPIALVMRLLGRDRMMRRFDADASSYWSAREGDSSHSRYFRQS